MNDSIYAKYDWERGKNLMFTWEDKLNQEKEQLLEKYVGTVQPVLIEGYDPLSEQFVGRLWFQAPEIDGCVYIDELPETKSSIVNVEIVDVIGEDVMSIFHSEIETPKGKK